jgi:hypothetical protein
MKIKYILGGIGGLLLLVALIALLPIDSKLDADAAAWGEAANDTADTANNGYYYLMGLIAAPDEDPAVMGKALHDEYLKAEREFLDHGGEFAASEYPYEKMLPRIKGDYFCMLRDDGCFARLGGDPVALRSELTTYAVLVERYRRLLGFAELKPLTQPTFYELVPPYGHVIDGNRVNQLSIIQAQRSGNRPVALEMLRRDMEQLRRHIASAHTLFEKMVMLSMFANDLDLLAHIAAPGDMPQGVPALSAQERTLRPQLQREFGGVVNYHRDLDSHPEAFDETADGAYYGWLLRVTVRPNMTINSMYGYFRDLADLSELDAAAFNARAQAGTLPQIKTAYSLRNIGGSILNSVAAPAFAPYIARVHDIDCKIALLDAALVLDAAVWREILEGRRELAAANPYRPGEKPYVEAGALCFSGPFPDVLQHRCIRRI